MSKIEKSRIERAIIFLGLTALVIWGLVNGIDFENEKNIYLTIVIVAGYLWVFGGWIACFLYWFEKGELEEKEKELLQEKIYKIKQEKWKLEAETEKIKSETKKKVEKDTKKQQ